MFALSRTVLLLCVVSAALCSSRDPAYYLSRWANRVSTFSPFSPVSTISNVASNLTSYSSKTKPSHEDSRKKPPLNIPKTSPPRRQNSELFSKPSPTTSQKLELSANLQAPGRNPSSSQHTNYDLFQADNRFSLRLPSFRNTSQPPSALTTSGLHGRPNTAVPELGTGLLQASASSVSLVKTLPSGLADDLASDSSNYPQEIKEFPAASSSELHHGLSDDERDPRFFGQLIKVFPLFSLVNITPLPCVSNSGDNGTCYTSAHCKLLGGGGSGSCGGGFGTCCIFQKTCGGVATQNCTYFVNENYPQPFNGVGSCQLTVNKLSSNVCQLRLDFQDLTLSGPEAIDHICINDRFTVSGGTRIPSLCGVNTGNHMYVTVGPGTTTPPVITVATMGPATDRKWKIKVTQIPCDTPYTAPSHCLQYYTGVTGTVKSYNYDTVSGLELSNQDYTICIRTEKNFCGIQYAACADSAHTANPQSFSLTGSTSGPVGTGLGATECRKDWINIPCLSDNSLDPTINCEDRLCGDTFSLTQGGRTNKVLYSFVRPFNIIYHTNGVEGTASPTEVNNRGFCLNYVQQPCV